MEDPKPENDSTLTEKTPDKFKKEWQGKNSRAKRTDAYRAKTNITKN
jgi:hypothetical protein